MKPQTARVLRRLRHGPVGSTDFAAPDVCDGLSPITRVAPRVLELRELGFVIRSERAANGTAVYTLEHDVERAAGSRVGVPGRPVDDGATKDAPDGSLSTGSLFDAQEFAAGRASYRDAA